jgi:hypothetical protein
MRKHQGDIMRTKLILCTAAAFVLGSTAIASAQGGMTDRNSSSNGSERVGNGAAMQRPAGTVGTSNSVRSERDSPNGSPGAAPKAKAGPSGDPSKDNDAPK